MKNQDKPNTTQDNTITKQGKPRQYKTKARTSQYKNKARQNNHKTRQVQKRQDNTIQ